MIDSTRERDALRSERLASTEEPGQAEEIALAALVKKLRAVEVEAESVLTAIMDTEITSREAQRLTLNSRHNLEFFKQRFPNRFCSDGSRRVVAFPRAEVEQYMEAYRSAAVLPDDYNGRRITSLASEAYPLATIFSVMRDIDIPIRLFANSSSRQVTEYIDEDFIELVELGLAELEPEAAVDDTEEVWQSSSLVEQLQAVSTPSRAAHSHATISWDDDLFEITHIPPRPKLVVPAWLHKTPSLEAPSWKPRYIRNLSSLMTAHISLAQLDLRLGANATIALAAHHPDLAAAPTAIGLDEAGAPAATTEVVETLSELIASTEYSGDPIPDNWQTLEDIAKDANVKLDGEDGLEAWVAEGAYGPDHVATIPYQEASERRWLTFCSPQLARVVVDWVVRERQRLERAIELEEKYGRPGFEVVQPMIHEVSEAVDEEEEEPEVDAVEALRSKLQSLETFAAQYSLEVQWVYELIHAEHDAYIVDFTSNGERQYAHFATTEGVTYLLENLAPPEYRTSRQICDAYGIPIYLFATYATEVEPVGDFLSSEWCANVKPMPHYAPEQINSILSNYYNDVAEEPMRIAHIATKTGQTMLSAGDYLKRHGVIVDNKHSVLQQAGLRYIHEHQEIGIADETLQTPTLFLMRTREVRGSDLTHADITTMCYELNIPLVTLENMSAKKTTQHAPADRFPDLQAAIERYYIRSK